MAHTQFTLKICMQCRTLLPIDSCTIFLLDVKIACWHFWSTKNIDFAVRFARLSYFLQSEAMKKIEEAI